MLGHTLLDKGLVDQALAEHRKAFSLHSSPHTYDDLGTALAAKGDLNGAIQAYKNALTFSINPRTMAVSAPSDGVAASAYQHLGQALEQKGDKAGALEAYKHAGSAYYRLGQKLEKKGDKAAALDAYKNAATCDPFNAEYKNKVDALTSKEPM